MAGRASSCRRSDGIALWPFDDSDLTQLLAKRNRVIETYPGDAYSVLGVAGNNKTSQGWRKAAGRRMRDVLSDMPISFDENVARQLDEGFGAAKEGEDPFDAMVGAVLLALVALGERSPGLPVNPQVRDKEGMDSGVRPHTSQISPEGTDAYLYG